eukprot:1770660-Rhodomonas_salina.2
MAATSTRVVRRRRRVQVTCVVLSLCPPLSPRRDRRSGSPVRDTEALPTQNRRKSHSAEYATQ